MDMAQRGLRPASELASRRDHGDRLRYMGGCRCDLCRAANSRYECERARARKAGDWNGIVPAVRARAHLKKLSRQGVGRRAVQAATDIADSVLFKIRSGERSQIRARTERKILAVNKAVAGDRSLVCAAATWRLINDLLAEGYTKTFIAKRMGYTRPALQVGKSQVTVRMAADIVKIHKELTT
jgi:hypothetical protein